MLTPGIHRVINQNPRIPTTLLRDMHIPQTLRRITCRKQYRDANVETRPV